MRSVFQTVYGLFPTLEDMADTLGTTVNHLKRWRAAGLVPPPEHDHRILIVARAAGKRLTRPALERARRAPQDMAGRKKVIGRFFEAAGGVHALSEQTGLSPNHLYVSRTRGYLPKSARLELRQVAASIPFDLPDDIFDSPAS